MEINKINGGIIPNRKINKKEKTTGKKEVQPNMPVSKKRVGAAILAGLMLASLNAGKPTTAQAETTYTGKNYIDTINPADISYTIQPLNGAFIEQTDFAMPFLPVAEFYLPRGGTEVFLEPNQDVPRTPNGTIIIDISTGRSANKTEAATLMEVINKTYSDSLAGYDEETQTNMRNKVIDEIIQANPDLAEYLFSQNDDVQSSYRLLETRRLDLSECDSIIIPNQIVYQPQTEERGNLHFSQYTYTHKPEMETASVVGNSNHLLEGEYRTLPDLIYEVYGHDITPEAYRDILYAVVNAPENAEYFENVLNDMNFNEIMQTGSITDINRTLEENTSGVMLNLTMPTVKTTRVTPQGYDIVGGDRNDIIYQISPARIGSNQAERSIELTSRGNEQKVSGDLYDLVDVLQFYASPDGNGRFAEIDRNGWTILNDDINYFTPFATQIMQQVVYANLDIFTAPYEDENGIHPYGVFDVNNGYDVEGKTLEEIIENSTINIDRMNDFSFVDENGQCLFEDGTKLNLPQFNYRINYCEKKVEDTEDPVTPTPTPTPTTTETPTPTATVTPGPTESCGPTPTVPIIEEEEPTLPPVVTTPPPAATTKPPVQTTPPPVQTTPPPSATDVPADEPEEENIVCQTPVPDKPEEEAPVVNTQTPAPETTDCPSTVPEVIEEQEEAPTIPQEQTPNTQPSEADCSPVEQEVIVDEAPPAIVIVEEAPAAAPVVQEQAPVVHEEAPAPAPVVQEQAPAAPVCDDIQMADEIEVEEPPTL